MINFGQALRGQMGGMGMPSGMGGGMPGMMHTDRPQPMWGGQQGGGGFGGWIRDPNSQMMLANILAGVGNAIGQERQLGHQRDILDFEKRRYEDEEERRRRVDEYIRSLGV